MSSLDHYIARHGECGAQALIELLERVEGVRTAEAAPLEERWALLMDAPDASAIPYAA